MSANEHQYFLRPLEPKDAKRMLEWMHDKDTTCYLRLNGINTTEEDALLFIQKAQDEHTNLHRAIVDCKDTYLGTVSLKNIDYKNQDAEYAIAMHPSALGTGAAFFASKSIFKIAFNHLVLSRVYLNVLEENERAIRFYNKLWFLGLQREKETITDFNGLPKKLVWYAVLKSRYINDEVQEN